MKLPHGDLAVVDLAKLTDYCLNPAHPRGRHKARAFAASLGLTLDKADLLRDALLEAARTEEATRQAKTCWAVASVEVKWVRSWKCLRRMRWRSSSQTMKAGHTPASACA
jgi:hypothetical protein